MKKKSVIFLNDPNYSKKNTLERGADDLKKMVFLDHRGRKIENVIHAFPVEKKSVKLFLTQYTETGRSEFRFRRISKPENWFCYSLGWRKVKDFVEHHFETPPQPLKFKPEKHYNFKKMIWVQYLCGCYGHKEQGVLINWQVIFSPKPVSHIATSNTASWAEKVW